MATITAAESIARDGVMQAPASPDEDARGGFAPGGWAMPLASDDQSAIMGDGMAATTGMLFGRRTYDGDVGHWLAVPGPSGDSLRHMPKWVASRSGASLAHPVTLGSDARLLGDGPRRDHEPQRADTTSAGVTILQLAVLGGARLDEGPVSDRASWSG